MRSQLIAGNQTVISWDSGHHYGR